MDAGILSGALMAMERAGDSIFAGLMPSVMELFYWVKMTAWGICIAVMLLQQRFLHPAMAKALALFVVIGWLLQVYPTASEAVIQAMGNAGAIILPEMEFDLSDPGYIVYFGFKAVKPLMDGAREYLGPVAIFVHFFEFMFYTFAIVTVILAFLALAIHAFFARVEYLILRNAAWFVIPFAALGKTSFIATKGIGYIGSVGLRVLALGLLAAVSTVTLLKYEEYKVEDISAAFGLGVLSIALLVANVKAPSAAAALINSGPVLDGAMAWNALRAAASAGFQNMSQQVSAGMQAGRAAGGSASAMVLGVAQQLWSGGTSGFGNNASNSGTSHSSSSGNARTGGAWDGPPSNRQQKAARKMGVDISGMTKGQASLALENAGAGKSWYGGPGSQGSYGPGNYQGGWSQNRSAGNP